MCILLYYWANKMMMMMMMKIVGFQQRSNSDTSPVIMLYRWRSRSASSGWWRRRMSWAFYVTARSRWSYSTIPTSCSSTPALTWTASCWSTPSTVSHTRAAPTATLSTWVTRSVYLLTYIRLTALCPGLPGWAGTRKVKPVWILLKWETVGGSGISCAVCKSAPRSRQITMPAPHHSVFLQAGCPSCHPTNSVKALKANCCCTVISSN